MKSFSKRHTQILKGLAVIMLLVHHGLDPISAEDLGIMKDVIPVCVSLSKLCVAIFALLSGYGLYISFAAKERAGKSSAGRFVFAHILKIYAVFWLTAILSMIVVAVAKGSLSEVYPGHTVYYVFLELMGLSYLAKAPQFANAWWYISAVLIYYCLFPVLFWIVQRLKRGNYGLAVILAAAAFMMTGRSSIPVYGCVFALGMIAAERDWINRYLNWLAHSAGLTWVKELVCLLFLIAAGVFREQVLVDIGKAYHMDWLLALLLICLISELMCHVKWNHTGFFEFIGKYSLEMYLVHAVILKHFGEIIFRTYDWWAVFLRLFFATLLVSIALYMLRKLLRLSRISSWCFTAKRAGIRCVAVVLLAATVVLMIPEVIANIGIGTITLYKSEIQMEDDTWEVPVYLETPLFWSLANKKYSSTDGAVVSFVDGVLYSHKPGKATVTVSLPFGASVEASVTVAGTAQ